MAELTAKDMDPDTWLLYQVRQRSPKDYKRLADHVRELPSPARELRAKADRLQKELDRTWADFRQAQQDCKHVAWDSLGGEYIVETCVSCGKDEVY